MNLQNLREIDIGEEGYSEYSHTSLSTDVLRELSSLDILSPVTDFFVKHEYYDEETDV